MAETRSEVVEPGDRFKADTMLRVDLSDLVSNDIVSILHVDVLRQTWNHHQRIYVLISRPRLIYELVSNHILTIFESFSYFPPIVDEEVS